MQFQVNLTFLVVWAACNSFHQAAFFTGLAQFSQLFPFPTH